MSCPIRVPIKQLLSRLQDNRSLLKLYAPCLPTTSTRKRTCLNNIRHCKSVFTLCSRDHKYRACLCGTSMGHDLVGFAQCKEDPFSLLCFLLKVPLFFHLWTCTYVYCRQAFRIFPSLSIPCEKMQLDDQNMLSTIVGIRDYLCYIRRFIPRNLVLS